MEWVPPAAPTPATPGIWASKGGEQTGGKGRQEEEAALVGNLQFAVSVRDVMSLSDVWGDPVTGWQHPRRAVGTRRAGC